MSKTTTQIKENNMSKVKNFKENFWKRGIAKAVVTPLQNGFEYNVELYSFNKNFLGSRVILAIN